MNEDKLTPDQKLHVMMLIANGDYQSAINYLVDLTSAITNMEPPLISEWSLWNHGYKVDAIRCYRTRVDNAGLKETKDLFERGT